MKLVLLSSNKIQPEQNENKCLHLYMIPRGSPQYVLDQMRVLGFEGDHLRGEPLAAVVRRDVLQVFLVVLDRLPREHAQRTAGLPSRQRPARVRSTEPRSRRSLARCRSGEDDRRRCVLLFDLRRRLLQREVRQVHHVERTGDGFLATTSRTQSRCTRFDARG